MRAYNAYRSILNIVYLATMIDFVSLYLLFFSVGSKMGRCGEIRYLPVYESRFQLCAALNHFSKPLRPIPYLAGVLRFVRHFQVRFIIMSPFVLSVADLSLKHCCQATDCGNWSD